MSRQVKTTQHIFRSGATHLDPRQKEANHHDDGRAQIDASHYVHPAFPHHEDTKSPERITEAVCFYLILSFVPFVPLWFSSSTHKLSTYCATDQKPKVEGAEQSLSDGLAYTFVTGVYESRAESFTRFGIEPRASFAQNQFFLVASARSFLQTLSKTEINEHCHPTHTIDDID